MTLYRPKMPMTSSLLTLAALSTAGCASIQPTTYEQQFDPPKTYIDFMGDRLPPSAVSSKLIAQGVDAGHALGLDLEFDGAVDSEGCADICLLFRHRFVDDIYVVFTTDAKQMRLRRRFDFSPLDSGSP